MTRIQQYIPLCSILRHSAQPPSARQRSGLVYPAERTVRQVGAACSVPFRFVPLAVHYASHCPLPATVFRRRTHDSTIPPCSGCRRSSLTTTDPAPSLRHARWQVRYRSVQACSGNWRRRLRHAGRQSSASSCGDSSLICCCSKAPRLRRGPAVAEAVMTACLP
jgi:hypothetical protein